MSSVMSPRKHAAIRCAAGLSHVGLVRETNEDAVHVGEDGRLLVCADGLGGLPCGEIASRLAVDCVVAAMDPYLAAGARRSSVGWARRLRRAFFAAHVAVMAAGRERRALGGIATTLVAALVSHRRAYVCHVGDVRAYRWRLGELRRLTEDHSVVFEAVRSGALTVEEARLHPHRNLVTQAVGLAEGFSPSSTSIGMAAGDLLVLCSDGLWETMPEDEMAATLDRARDPQAIAESLLGDALAAGGPDNVSIIVYRHGRGW